MEMETAETKQWNVIYIPYAPSSSERNCFHVYDIQVLAFTKYLVYI